MALALTETAAEVSILVLVDVFPELTAGFEEGTYDESFNPCFSGCLSRILTLAFNPNHPNVSILVLVDVFPEWRCKS